MIYSNTQSGGYFNPMMNMMPSGFQGNNNYMAYGPNIMPNDLEYQEEDYEQRISKLERQVRKLEARVSKLESSSDILDDSNNMYMV